MASVTALLKGAAQGELALSRGTVEELGALLNELQELDAKPVASSRRKKARS